MNKTWFLWVFSLFLFSSCSNLDTDGPSATSVGGSHLQQAEQLIKKGNFQSAYLHLTQALASAPRDPDIHLNLGWLYLYTDEPEKARDELKKVLAMAPDSPKGEHLKGAIYSYLQQDEDAIQSYNQALKAENLSPQLHYDMANSLTRLNENHEALIEYKTALKLLPKADNPSQYQFAVCSTYYKLKNLQQAEAYCKQAAENATEPSEKERITDFIENLKLLQSL